MKLNILNVPEELANAPATDHTGGVLASPVTNDGNTPPPSPAYTPAQRRDAIEALAREDGWYSLYNPQDSVVSGGVITSIPDTLGNLPPLVAGDTPAYRHNFPGLSTTRVFSGYLSTGDFPAKNLTVMMMAYAPDWTGADDSDTDSIFSLGFSETLKGLLSDFENYSRFNQVFQPSPDDYAYPMQITTNRAQIYSVFGDLGAIDYFGSSLYAGVMGMSPTIFTISSKYNSLYVGHRHVAPDNIFTSAGSPPEETAYTPMTHLSVSSKSGDHPTLMGPILVAEGDITDDMRSRMVSLLERLYGLPKSMLPSESERLPESYAVAAPPRGSAPPKTVMAHLPDRPGQLASLTKVLTCYLARQVVPNAMLDDLITAVPTYKGLMDSKQPVLQLGDQISWRDAFHLSLKASHNYVTNLIAYHAALLMNPSSSSPYDDFVAHMNDFTQNTQGWTEAFFSTPQGRYNSILTPRHFNELLHLTFSDTFLRSAMDFSQHTGQIHRVGGSIESFEVTNLISQGVPGTPGSLSNLLGAKGGDTPVIPELGASKRAVAGVSHSALYATSRLAMTALGVGSGYRQDLVDLTRSSSTRYGPPPGWVAAPGSTVEFMTDHFLSLPGIQNVVFPSTGIQGFAEVEPFDTFHTARPRLLPGDEVTISYRFYNPNFPLGEESVMEASLVGGSFDTPSGKLTTPTTTAATRTATAVVKESGLLKVSIRTPMDAYGGGINSSRVTDVSVSITRPSLEGVGEYSLNLVTYSANESIQSWDASNLSGTVGDFSADIVASDYQNVISTFGPGYLRDKEVRLQTDEGVMTGTVLGVSTSAGGQLVTLNCASSMGALNAYNVSAPPFQGTLRALLETYFGLVGGGAVPPLVVDPDIASREVIALGWTGELWVHLKMLCAVERIKLTLEDNGNVRASANTSPEMPVLRAIDQSVDYNLEQLSQFVEVYNYQARPITDELVYPAGGWNENVEVLSVNAGEYVEHVIELGASITSFQTPEQWDMVTRGHQSSSVYTIIGDDGLPVRKAQWEARGGVIDFEIGADSRTIIVKMTGATGIYNTSGSEIQSYSLALASDSSGGRYSTLRIVGSGVGFNRKLMRFPTGVPPRMTGTDVGVTIDIPFIRNNRQAVEIGSLIALRHSGFSPSAGVTVASLPEGGWGADIMGKKFENGFSSFRITSGTYTPESSTLQGEYALSYAELEESLNGMTYNEWESSNEDLNYNDTQARGNNYEH